MDLRGHNFSSSPRRLRRALPAALIVLCGLLAAPAAQAATALYPDLKTLSPRELRFDRTDVSPDGSGQLHNVLRFSNTVWNSGAGRLELRGQIDPATKTGPAMQRVYDDSGGSTDYATGNTFYWHAVHSHYHFDNWGRYQLWTKSAYDAWIASGRNNGTPADIGTKTTSCVMDEEFIRTQAGTPYPPPFSSDGCFPNSQNLMMQGLSSGWGDTYDYYRYEQWIDLDQGSLADGDYVLRSVTDPNNLVYESPNKADASVEGQQDNEGVTNFTVLNGKVIDSTPPTGSVFVNGVDDSTATPNVNVKVIGRDDVSGVDQFRLSNDGSHWSSAMAYTSSDSTPTSVSWNLANATYGGTSADGVKTVYAQFHDKSGKWSSASITDTISLVSGASSAYAQSVMADSPAGYWRLGEASGSTASDLTGANSAAYKNSPGLGAASLLAGEPGNTSVHFDGTSDYAEAPSSTSLSPGNQVSVEAWVKPDALPTAGNFASIVSKPESYSLQFNGPRLEFTIVQGGARRRLQAPAGAVATGQTYHVVGTFDGTTQRLYLNGSEVANAPLTGAIGTSSGGLDIASWGGFEFLQGTVDEAAVYGSVLSAGRVAAHYSAATGATPPINAPSALSATAISTSQINLSWNDNSSNETEFTIERDTSASFSSPTVKSTWSNATTFADTGMSPGTTYYYRVKARNSTDVSGWSNSASAATPASQPPPSGYGSAVLADAPVSWWRFGETSGTTAADQKGANPGSYTGGPALGAAGLLSADTDKAASFDGVNDTVAFGGASSLDISTPLTLEAWIKPGSLPAAGSFASVLTKPEQYSLQFNGPRMEFTVIQFGVRKRLQAPVGAVAAGQTYHVVGTFDGTTQRLYLNGSQVASVALTGGATSSSDGLYAGSWGGGVEFMNGTIDEPAVYNTALAASRVSAHYTAGTGSAPPVAAPTGLTATGASTSQINLAWADNSSNETGFTIQRDTSSSFSAPQTINLGSGATSYQDTGRSPSTTYYYRVKATNSTTSSSYSNTASAATQATPAVNAPTGLAATAVSTSQINLAWTDNSSNETGFTIQRDTNSSFTAPQTFTVGSGVTSYQSTGLAAATTYYYRVKATNGSTSSAYSTTASATTQSPAPPPPTGYAAAVTADSPVSYWRLGETSGSSALDQKSANPGTYLNAPTLGAASLLGTDTTNKAVTFDGVNDQVRIGNSTSLGLTSPVTLEAWIKPTALPAAGSFASVVTKAESYSIQFNGPKLEFTIMQFGVRQRLQAASGAIVAGQKYHVAGSYDGATMRLYVNGVQVASKALTGAATTTSNALFIGSWDGGSEFFKGTIDEVAVYRATLSATRVSAHYTAGK